MIIEIEYFKGDTKLYGHMVKMCELQKQFEEVTKRYDPKEDNFIGLLCRMHDWSVVETDSTPQYIYDMDTNLLIKQKI